MTKSRSSDRRGFSLIELLFVVGIIGVVGAIAVPMMGNTLGFFRLSGDARSAANAVALAKMRAASVFGRVRLYLDVPGRSFHPETFDKATSTWIVDGGTVSLSQTVTFGFGPVSSAPPNTQGTIGQSAPCKNNAGTADIPNTSCVIFNSRGVPIDSTGAPVIDAIYVTDGATVYGVTVSATGMVRSWRTLSAATPTWGLR
jgi:prepilin-type N-terminal cleavage/methylation domain-containing protein